MKGPIDQTPILEQGLPKEYLAFLREHDPIENWEDVVPLDKPLKTKEVEYPIPWDEVTKLQNLAPSLGQACNSVEFGNKLAPMLGLRYAYLRLGLHAHLLNALENLIPIAYDKLTGIVEVGCFNGGLLHFIAEQYSPIQTVGLDFSPVALDLASDFSDKLETDPKTMWLETNFSLLSSDVLEGDVKDAFSSPLIILSNMIADIGRQLSLSPAVDTFHAQAGLVSHWVNQGALVLVSERNDSPENYLQVLIDKARWEGDDCVAMPIEVFEAWSTESMNSETNPIGEWQNTKVGIFLFYNKKKWGLC